MLTFYFLFIYLLINQHKYRDEIWSHHFGGSHKQVTLHTGVLH